MFLAIITLLSGFAQEIRRAADIAGKDSNSRAGTRP